MKIDTRFIEDSVVAGGLPLNEIVIQEVDGKPYVCAFLRDDDGDLLHFNFIWRDTKDEPKHCELILKTESYEYVNLNGAILKLLVKLNKDATKAWAMLDHYSDGDDSWVGFEDLITQPKI